MNADVNRIAGREWPAVEAILSPPRGPEDWRLGPPDYWEYRASPGFPVEWPPVDGRATLVYYLSGAGRNPSKLADGEWYSSLWGLVYRDVFTEGYEFRRMAGTPSRAGTQGVRPLMPAEVKIFEDRNLDHDFALGLKTGNLVDDLTRRVRAYYGLWAGFHGVAREIHSIHTNFSGWLKNLRDGG